MNFSLSIDNSFGLPPQKKDLEPSFKKYKTIVYQKLNPLLKNNIGVSPKFYNKEKDAIYQKKKFFNDVGVFAIENSYRNRNSNTDTISRYYAVYNFHDDSFFKMFDVLVREKKNLFFHELNYGLCKFFIDFDKSISSEIELLNMEKIYKDFKSTFIKSLLTFITNTRGDDFLNVPKKISQYLDDLNATILENRNTLEKEKVCTDKQKFSVHYIIPKLVFINAANVGCFLVFFLVNLFNQRKYDLFAKLIKIIDWGVYKKHTLRTYYSLKYKDFINGKLHRKMYAVLGNKINKDFNLEFLKDSLLTYHGPSSKEDLFYICFDEKLNDIAEFPKFSQMWQMYNKLIGVPSPHINNGYNNNNNNDSNSNINRRSDFSSYDIKEFYDKSIATIVLKFINAELNKKKFENNIQTNDYQITKMKLFRLLKCFSFELAGKFCFVRGGGVGKLHSTPSGRSLWVNLKTRKISFKCPFNPKCKRICGGKFLFPQNRQCLNIVKLLQVYFNNNCN